jgi:hypothetical protein
MLSLYRLFFCFVLCVLCLCLPLHEAHAFGPITHINLGSQILQHLDLLPSMLAALLQGHPHAYLYGNMAADVIIAKNLARSDLHCHNWDIGFSILEEAQDEQQQAFAWGYLSHLAADTIAHNYYVPWKLVESFPARTAGHAYWELRLDQRASPAVWDLARYISRQKFQGPRALLSRTIQGTIFNFETNLVLFNGMLFVQRLKRWQGMLDRVNARSRWDLDHEQALALLEMARQAILDLLCQSRESQTCLADPTGIPNLHAAGSLSKSLRKSQRQSPLSPGDLRLALDSLHRRFRESIVHPFTLPHDLPSSLYPWLKL